MPHVHIVKKTTPQHSFRNDQIRGMFDFSDEEIIREWNVNIPIEEKKWNIGLIVGNSGSGKSTIAREGFVDFKYHQQFDWDDSKSVAENIKCETTKDVVEMFNACGFSSTPHWLKPFSHLSTGQKFRVELARAMLEYQDGFICDEFTSVVDRDVAKIASAAISKALFKNNKRMIAVSCHYDIIEWLDPDWIFDTSKNEFSWRLRTRRPSIELKIYQVNRETWKIFREHHYLNHDISVSAQCFVAEYNDQPVAFTSFIHFPHPSAPNIKREHRTVVLPEFQGIGIGNKLSDWLGEYCKKNGNKFFSLTSAPSMIRYRAKSLKWKCKRLGHSAKKNKTRLSFGSSRNRITGSFEYVG